MHPAYRHSGIARPVDPAYPTNKAVLVLAPLALLGGFAYAWFTGDSSLGAAALVGLEAALLLFLTWALTRELSPDDNPAAFVAVALAFVVWPRVGEQSLLTVAAVLMAVRLVNRSTGKAGSQVDSVLVAGLFAAVTWTVSGLFGLVGALAFALDASLPAPGEQPRRRRHWLFALAMVLVLVARVLVGFDGLELPAHLPVFATVAGLCALAVLTLPRPSSVGDVDERPLSHARVRAGLGLGLLAAILLSVDAGLELQRVASLWACILAVPLGLPIVALRRRRAQTT